MAAINGLRGWKYVNVSFLGRSRITGVTALDYDDTMKKENFYGAGDRPQGRGEGNYEAKATITLRMEEVEAIERSLAPGQSLTDIAPFDITVLMLPNNSNVQKKDIIHNCEFTGNNRKLKQGDGSFEIQLELVVSEITWNAP